MYKKRTIWLPESVDEFLGEMARALTRARSRPVSRSHAVVECILEAMRSRDDRAWVRAYLDQATDALANKRCRQPDSRYMQRKRSSQDIAP